jgi:hypothetical protein
MEFYWFGLSARRSIFICLGECFDSSGNGGLGAFSLKERSEATIKISKFGGVI